MQDSQSVGISLPVSLLKRIDSERGDIPRSRFLWLLQKLSYDNIETYIQDVNKKDSVDQRTEIPQSTEPLIT